MGTGNFMDEFRRDAVGRITERELLPDAWAVSGVIQATLRPCWSALIWLK